MNDIVTIISTVGFPIAACIGLGAFVKYIMDIFFKQVGDLSEAVKNNTIVMEKLLTKLGEDE